MTNDEAAVWRSREAYHPNTANHPTGELEGVCMTLGTRYDHALQ